jgi:hypothetical protein
MPCDTKLKAGQTITERKAEVLSTVETVRKGLVSGRVKPTVGPQGAIAFEGLTVAERNDVTDACIYRRLLVSASPLALAAIAKAEQVAGRNVNRTAVGQGAHSHDGGRTWHSHKG